MRTNRHRLDWAFADQLKRGGAEVEFIDLRPAPATHVPKNQEREQTLRQVVTFF
ncbi:hypothetical protein [Fimbriiglobus ruber]|uniref:Uncharacterized protein n=1 Tax=Fimbriiglobus ruber TaxID=1908690 RepID=A0A225DKT6_9BACT|nr:hypothetical protein [Fimbriiglobus ruber]OWK37789.1 hypothetical protein FRUB_06909 [Fimbriiglobus ruber]